MSKLNLYQKLHLIQTKIIGLSKDKASNSYRYVTGDKVLEYIKPLMNEHHIILKQEILSIDNERMDYEVSLMKNEKGEWKGKPKSEILSKVMMRFTWIDCESGEKDENSFGANGQNDWEKGLGSALTYAERYFLLKFFHIATDEDDIDNDDRKPDIKQPIKQSVDVQKCVQLLDSSKSITELVKAWESLSKEEQKNAEILAKKDNLKKTLK